MRVDEEEAVEGGRELGSVSGGVDCIGAWRSEVDCF